MAHTVAVGNVFARRFREADIERNPLRCADRQVAGVMEDLILSARREGDSVGGEVEVILRGLPGAWLEEASALVPRLSEALVSIGAVKGISLEDSPRMGELRMRMAVKPTPSISLPQRSVNVRGAAVKVSAKGRHDPCIAPRIVPVAEAMAALVLADILLAP